MAGLELFRILDLIENSGFKRSAKRQLFGRDLHRYSCNSLSNNYGYFYVAPIFTTRAA